MRWDVSNPRIQQSRLNYFIQAIACTSTVSTNTNNSHNDPQQVNNEDKYFRERMLFSLLGGED